MSEAIDTDIALDESVPARGNPELKAAKKRAAELVRASQIQAKEDRARTWFHVLTTLGVLGAAEAVAIAPFPWPLRLLGAVIAGLTTVRAFIIYHDWAHGA